VGDETLRSAVALLALSAMALAAATITLTVNDGKVALSKIVVEAEREKFPFQYGESLVSSQLVAVDKLWGEGSSVKESFSTNSALTLSSSPLKKGRAEITLSITSDPTTVSLHSRIKGSVLVLFFYIRNMDIVLNSVINKQDNSGNLTIDGFAELPSPKVTVEKMLNTMIPKIKAGIEDLGLKVVELKYEVTGKSLPPTSKVKMYVILKGERDKIVESLNSLGIPTSELLNLINMNDTVVRKVNAQANLELSLKRSGKELFTEIRAKVRGEGVYLNDTVRYELRSRLEPVLKALNVTELEGYLLPTNNVTSSLTVNVTGNKVKANFVFTNVYFNNTEELWKTLKRIEDELGVNFEVLCSGKVYDIERAASSCKG